MRGGNEGKVGRGKVREWDSRDENKKGRWGKRVRVSLTISLVKNIK